MIIENTAEPSPCIVVSSPVDEDIYKPVDIDISEKDDMEAGDLLTTPDPEVSRRLSVMSAGRRSLISTMTRFSLESAIIKYEKVFLVTVFGIMVLVAVLIGVFVVKHFFCEDCDQKKDDENVETDDDMSEWEEHMKFFTSKLE